MRKALQTMMPSGVVATPNGNVNTWSEPLPHFLHHNKVARQKHQMPGAASSSHSRCQKSDERDDEIEHAGPAPDTEANVDLTLRTHGIRRNAISAIMATKNQTNSAFTGSCSVVGRAIAGDDTGEKAWVAFPTNLKRALCTLLGARRALGATLARRNTCVSPVSLCGTLLSLLPNFTVIPNTSESACEQSFHPRCHRKRTGE